MSTFTELAAGPLLSPLAVLVAAIVLITTAYFTLTNNALAPIKGPLTAKWSRLWILYHARKGDLHRVMIDLHRKHGNLVRTGPKEVSVSDPSAVRAIYSMSITSKILYIFIDCILTSMLLRRRIQVPQKRLV